MIQAEKEYQVCLGLGFMRRHSPVAGALREMLSSGEIINHPALYLASDIRQIRPKLAMHDALQNGGPVIDMAVHYFDWWSYIFASKPTKVFAQGFSMARERPEVKGIQNLAIDTASITVTYASGHIGSFTVCWGLPLGVNPPGNLDQIYAPNGLFE